MKPLLIGEQPSKNGDPGAPLEGRIGHRLAEYCSIDYSTYLETFERRNLLDIRSEYMPTGNGQTFDAAMATLRAKELVRTRFAPGRLVIVCGKRAAGALGITLDYFSRCSLGNANVYVVPHPSSVNRWWNDVENQQQMRKFMTGLVTALIKSVGEELR